MSTDVLAKPTASGETAALAAARTLGGATQVPAWFPAWAREMAELYFAANTCVFILHGNVNDLFYFQETDATAEKGDRGQFCGLVEFIGKQIFGSWDTVVSYDLGRGIQAEAGTDAKRLQGMMQYLGGIIGSPTTWSREPDAVLNSLDRVIQRNLLEDNPANRKRIAFLFPFAQYLVPGGDHAMLARTQAARLVRFLSWAQNPYIKRVNMAFCLIAEGLHELSDELVQNPHVATIEVPLPGAPDRRRFIASQWGHLFEASPAAARESADKPSALTEAQPAVQAVPHSTPTTSTDGTAARLSVESVTQISNGLNLVNLNVALSRSARDHAEARADAGSTAAPANGVVDLEIFRRLKKGLIERQCHGLVSFVEPEHTLEMVVGHRAAIERLKQDARWIAEGRLDATPMGYLICGPVGTGKTFLAECYAGSIGIPCLSLRNFRSKYVGETEGNLERVLNVLRSLGPVLMIVDEADAALGNREMGGDSGTSGRVFSMIASQMGNTKYRGQIVWMLLTSRPELLPIDLKRQGRAEVHIPLLYPDDREEIAEMFRIMAKKNKISLGENAIPDVDPSRHLSGADIESIVLGAKREMLASGRDRLERADLDLALHSFIPSAQGLEKTLQEISAVLECTDLRFLPEYWQTKLAEPDARAKLQREVVQIRELIDRD